MSNPAPTCSERPSWTTDGIVVPHGKPAPCYIINLDADPKDRWKEIGEKYKTEIKQTLEEVKEKAGEAVRILLGVVDVHAIGRELDLLLPPPYGDELRGLAEATEIPVGELFVLNLVYDITSHCTGIVAQSSAGYLLHARNLDMPDDPELVATLSISRKATFAVQFQRGGKTVYSGVTTAGGVGLFTGQKPNSFTININVRRTGSWLKNALHLLRDHPGSALGFLVRDALADPDINYQGVLNRMTHIPMIASCYVTIAGTKPGEGAVISRDRMEAVKPFSNGVWKLDGTWYLLQTNNDHWTKPPHIEPGGEDKKAKCSYQRQLTGNDAMKKMGQSNLSPQGLIAVLSTDPVFNPHTLYTTIMSAADPSLMKSWIRTFDKPESAYEACR